MKIFHTHRADLAKLALLCFSVLLIPAQSLARDVSFAWTANPEPVIGYKLYYTLGANVAPPYEGRVPVVLGNVTTFTVVGLSPSEAYSFVLTAYNAIEESGYSTVVSVPPSSSPNPTIINISMK